MAFVIYPGTPPLDLVGVQYSQLADNVAPDPVGRETVSAGDRAARFTITGTHQRAGLAARRVGSVPTVLIAYTIGLLALVIVALTRLEMPRGL